MFLRFCLLLVVFVGGCATHPGTVDHVRFAADRSFVSVQTDAGVVRGVQGAGTRAFLGVPYAAPPIGDLRWRGPRAPEPWTGVRDATRIGSDCTQALGREAILGGGGGLVVGSEDCLFVNIYGPVPDHVRDDKALKPVMVYLHGGAFTIGAGANYDPSRLAVEQDRVVVTVNFRLGALGWLALPTFGSEGEGVGGNWGLMDQQAALRWVQANIAAFGGDPGDVTLFAESSGAWSACYLMASPGSEGLYHRVILQSGPCLEPSSLNAAADQAGPGASFAANLGCPGPDAAACLRRTPAWRIARGASTRSGINGPGSWGPVYGDALVPLSPPEAFAQGAFTRVPVIVGSNTDEGRLFAVEVRDMDRYAKETHWLYGEAGARALDRYPVGAEGPAATIAQSFTDSRFACPADALRRLLARHVPVHGYEFADRAVPFILPDWVTGLDMGAYHASELASVFGTSWIFTDTRRWTPAQRSLSDRMMGLWAGLGHDPDFETRWPKVSDGGGPVLVFDPTGDRVDATFHDRHQCGFWGGTALGPAEPS
ncbi:carboxylesterase [Brevundimonas sp. LM2]|uniref:carboxylesterase/lipase family protein n=1 Tax=Brevundimonas sp. LM2 TaxID=1938605 RepID=UPI000983EA04|nr:carboxylesterase family protein [Brevundimonas sp. LM2]AQR61535.1 carboxylesterase [Brevundimonas sp. LM2]